MGSQEEEKSRRPPPGVELIRRLTGKDFSRRTYRTSVLIITFIAYASYHASRKPSSIVKSVLDPESNENSFRAVTTGDGFSWLSNLVFIENPTNSSQGSSSEGWAPFNKKGGTALLGEIDVAFLSVYSLGMYFSGHVGDRVDLRVFLTVGMVGSGIFVALFGMGYWLNIHNFYFFLCMQMMAGLFQATGWPSVVAVVGNWFGKRKRGLIMGIWNAHTSVGNICGSLMAASVLQYGWGWSFVLPGAVIALAGILVFMFLVVNPEDVGFLSPYRKTDNKSIQSVSDEEAGLPTGEKVLVVDEDSEGGVGRKVDEQMDGTGSTKSNAVGFIEAWKIPGVASFALCLFFSKLVAYTFLYWLPFYISHTAIGGKYVSVKSSGDLSTLFDLGGVVGGILAGHISDRLNARAITAASFMYCAIPALFLYRLYGGVSMTVNIMLMMIAGLFVNGPYALITTAVSADLGTHSSLKGNSRALATVTAIIDGTGSVGAALGPLLTGFISTNGWNGVFTMLMISALVSGLLLTRLVIAEIREKVHKAQDLSAERSRQQDTADIINQPLLRERQ
uniref:TSA: Wollemia nobilis Ref_Wollemi_Transcript_8812_3231 transcribed RNA sequence n=1 Tax=Wollemia nobilis TaxID=56998 RepID=A0A0C9RWG8_9CONI